MSASEARRTDSDLIETSETSQGMEQRNPSVNFNKSYKNRFNKQKKKGFLKKKGSHRDVNAVQKSNKEASKDQSRKDERFEESAFCVERKRTSS